MPSFCAVLNCAMRGNRDIVSFYRFPAHLKKAGSHLNRLSKERREMWCKALRRGPLTENQLKNGRVCSRHFISGSPAILLDRDNPDWIPTQNMGYHDPTEEAQTPVNRHDRRKRKREYEETKMEFIPPPFPRDFDVWEFALKHFPTTPKYNQIIAPYKNLTTKERESLPYIKHCLSIYLSCPEIYNVSQKHFKFVEKPKFKKLTEDLSFRPGLNDDLLELLKIKVDSFTKNDKYCMLSIEEVSLKPQLYYSINSDVVLGFEDDGTTKNFLPATKGYVILANGLYTRLLRPWKQPIAYFVSNEPLSPPEIALKVLETIDKLQGIGLKVMALVSSKVGLAKILNVSPDKPYFGVNKEKVFFFFDTGRLMVKTRNVLRNFQIDYNGETPRWGDIVEINEKREGRKCPLHNLGDRHVDLETVTERRNISLAIETLNHMVAAELELVLKKSKGDLHTAMFLARMDRMYNIFNSPIKSKSDPKYYQPYKDNKVQHFALRHLLKFTKEVKIYDSAGGDVSDGINTFTCWNININSLQMMWNVLKYKKFKHLFTSWINLNYMRQLLASAGGGKRLTVNTLRQAFQKEFTKCLVHVNDKTARDQDKHASDLIDSAQVGQFKIDPQTSQKKTRKRVAVRDTDYRHHNLDTLTYKIIRSYLLKQCRDVHYCRICGNFSEDNAAFVEYVCKLDSVFEENFGRVGLEENCLNKYIEMCELFQTHPCPTFPKKYLLRLFARMKMFYCLKTANTNFKEGTGSVEFSFGMMPAF